LYGIEVDDAAHLVWFSDDDDPGDVGGQRRALAVKRREQLAKTGRPTLAAIQNSDSHSLAEFNVSVASRTLTRYKMTELSFEGFRTALTDAGSRVRPKALIPSAIPRIRGIQLTSGFLDGEVYRFSDNLNTFIGGRGTGKSTAVRSLAYGLGLGDDFADHGNCPDAVTVFCEDANGVLYRYERQKGATSVARSKIGKTVQDVPLDSFKVEYYGQGDLAAVAKDPLKNPALLQSFLDRHLTLGDLLDRERMVLEEVEGNSAELIPFENSAVLLSQTQHALAEIEKKLDVAKEGKLQELAELQAKISAEKSLSQGLRDFAGAYEKGLSFSLAKKNYDALKTSVGQLTGDAECEQAFRKANDVTEEANAWIPDRRKIGIIVMMTKFQDMAEFVIEDRLVVQIDVAAAVVGVSGHAKDGVSVC
jgi:hypothetical protein